VPPTSKGRLSRGGRKNTWIFDSYYKGCVELWSRDKELTSTSIAYPSCFYMHLKDPHAHREMIEGLEGRYRAKDCSFRTIYGVLQGCKIYADRSIAEKIEKQTNYAAELYNVDVRQDQRYMAENDIFPAAIEMNLDSRRILRSL
jgi:DNA polymerase I